MLAIAPETMPAKPVELVARCIAIFAGRLPFAAAHQGKETDDPNISAEFESVRPRFRSPGIASDSSHRILKATMAVCASTVRSLSSDVAVN